MLLNFQFSGPNYHLYRLYQCVEVGDNFVLFNDDFSINFRCVTSTLKFSVFNYLIFSDSFGALFKMTLCHFLSFLAYFLFDFSDLMAPRLGTAVSVI